MPLSRRDAVKTLGAAGLLAASGRRLLAGEAALDGFVGTFTYPKGEQLPPEFGAHNDVSHGLYRFRFDPATGKAGPIQLAAEIESPAHLIVHSNRRVLYACQGQRARVDNQNIISAFAIEPDRLRPLNQVPCGGDGPSVGVVDRSGRNLLTSNWSSNSVVCIRLHPDGSLGERSALIGNPPGTRVPPPRPGDSRPATPTPAGLVRSKPHSVILSPSERYAIVAEIALNRCAVYRFDADTGSLQAHGFGQAHADSGPRHLARHPNGRFIYSADEEGSSVTAWRWDERSGAIEAIQQAPTVDPDQREGNMAADIVVHPSGDFVYASNRGSGYLAGFRIDPHSGKLQPLPRTKLSSSACWSLDADPSGRWLLTSTLSGDDVSIYQVDARTGALRDTGQRLPVVTPTCLRLA
ncbi:MAG: lactonase family protein [Pseudoxanthomonas sp.]